MQQDELATLFQQSLNLQAPAARPQPEQHIEIETEAPQQQQHEHRPAPIIYASMHYTPNNLLISRPASAPNLNSPSAGPTNTTTTATATEPTSPSVLVPLPSARTNPHLIATFARNDIDIADLSPGQLELFTGADSDQQLRLLELWRITLRGAAAEDGVWTAATSLEMEERLARDRWERLQQQQQHQQRPMRLDTDDASAMAMMDMMTDDECSSAAASPTSTLASPRMMGIHGQLSGAEPYMLSGYEQLAKREYEQQQQQQQQQQQMQTQGFPRRQGMVHGYSGATDPVYKAAVENQYGAFQAMREYGYESTGAGAGGGWYGDDEMTM